MYRGWKNENMVYIIKRDKKLSIEPKREESEEKKRKTWCCTVLCSKGKKRRLIEREETTSKQSWVGRLQTLRSYITLT